MKHQKIRHTPTKLESHHNLVQIEFDVELLPIANPLARAHNVHRLMKLMHVKVFEYFFFGFFVFFFMSFTSFMNINKRRCVVLKLEGIKLPLQEKKNLKENIAPAPKPKDFGGCWTINKRKLLNKFWSKSFILVCVFFKEIVVHVFQFVTNCIHLS